MLIDYSSLEKAIAQLEKSISFFHSKLGSENEDLREQFRAASIQAFEFTYEIAIKLLKRQLEQIVPSPVELEKMSFMDFIRTAFETGLINNVPPFRVYRKKRNITSHTYDEKKAEEIMSIISPFLSDMQFILKELKERNSGHETND